MSSEYICPKFSHNFEGEHIFIIFIMIIIRHYLANCKIVFSKMIKHEKCVSAKNEWLLPQTPIYRERSHPSLGSIKKVWRL